MQSETEYSFFTVIGSYGKQDTWASNWTFHTVSFFFSLKCAKVRIDHRHEGHVGDSKIFFVVARQKIFRFVSNLPSFSFLESFWDGSWCMGFVWLCHFFGWTLNSEDAREVSHLQSTHDYSDGEEMTKTDPWHGERPTVLRSQCKSGQG